MLAARASITTNHRESNKNVEIITTTKSSCETLILTVHLTAAWGLFSLDVLSQNLPPLPPSAGKMFIFPLEMIFELDIGNMQR